MNYVKGFFVSLLLHGLVAGFIIFGSMNMGAPDNGKQTVDISMIMIDAPDDGGDEEIIAPPPPPPPPSPAPPKPKPTPAPEPKPKPQVIKPAPDEITYKNAEPEPPLNESDAGDIEETEDYSEVDYGDYDGPYSDTGDAGVIGGVEGGTGDPEAEAGKQAARLGYVRDNYSYIQKRIKDKLVYPSQAKRTGASGQVTVVFTINEDGTASDIYVEKSSGHAILDTAAVETVRKASPFRKPPLPAQIAIPIDFKLR